MFKNLLVCAVLFSSSVPAISSPLKQIGAESLESVVTTTAKGLLVPGAVVLLLTPQGNFKVDFGTTELGNHIPPSPTTHFRIASNTKTMTAAIILQPGASFER